MSETRVHEDPGRRLPKTAIASPETTPACIRERDTMKSIRTLIAALILLLAIPLATLAAPAQTSHPQAAQSSLSGQCNYYTYGPTVSGSQVVGWVQLLCSVSHTRQIQVCIVASQPGSDTRWWCYTGAATYGKSFFQSNSHGYSYPADNWTWNVWFWIYDYSNSETWSGYVGSWQWLGVGAYGYA